MIKPCHEKNLLYACENKGADQVSGKYTVDQSLFPLQNAIKFTRIQNNLLIIITNCVRSGPEVIKLFSCSTQLSIKFKLLINYIIAKIN